MKGDEIPVEGQIIGVADVFASLVEEQPSRPVDALEQATLVLDELAGNKVDAPVFQTLKQLIDEHAPVM